MSKKKPGDTIADQIAKFIGKSMGELVNKKESLERQLADVERPDCRRAQQGAAAVRRHRAGQAPGQASREGRGQGGQARVVAGDAPQDGGVGQAPLGQGASGCQGDDRQLSAVRGRLDRTVAPHGPVGRAAALWEADMRRSRLVPVVAALLLPLTAAAQTTEPQQSSTPPPQRAPVRRTSCSAGPTGWRRYAAAGCSPTPAATSTTSSPTS